MASEPAPPVVPRVIMLSGASRGIGRALAQRLAADGHSLSLGVRRPSDAAARLGLDPARTLWHRFDALDAPSAAPWLTATLARFGRLDALINNAGILRPMSFSDGDEALLDESFAVNVKAPLRLIRLALPHLRQTGNGRIINIASTDGKRYRDASVSLAYALSKHALVALTHAARFEGWSDGVRVTALCPGAVDTELVAAVPGVVPSAARLKPETVAEIVAFLLRLPNQASIAELVVNTRLEAWI
jgi:NAD(P)-dependent dehydrogenase (short-subunit alcohol dehydrogenase family)